MYYLIALETTEDFGGGKRHESIALKEKSRGNICFKWTGEIREIRSAESLKTFGNDLDHSGTSLNQILYDYKWSRENRFKGLDLVECLMNYI